MRARSRTRVSRRVSAWTGTDGPWTSDEVGPVIGSASDPIAVVGRDGSVLHWNDAAAATFAAGAGDARDLKLPMLFAPFEGARVHALVESARATEAQATLVALRGDASRFIAEVTLRPLDAAPPGGSYVLIARDATERALLHAASAAFAAARELTTALASFRDSLVPVYAVAGLELSVVGQERFRRAAWAGDPLPLPETAVGAATQARAPLVVANTREGRSRHDRPLSDAGIASYAVFPIFDRDRVLATLNVGFDRPNAASPELVGLLDRITAAVAPSILNLLALKTQADTIRRLGRRDTLKNEFVALITHDIRAPVSVISGFAETLRTRWNELPEEDKLECVDAILRNGRSLAHIAGAGLDVALLESGEFRVAPQVFDVAEQIEQTARDFAGHGARNRIRPAIPERFPLVYADPDRHWQVLTNLISNAVKFSAPEEPIEIALDVEGRYVRIEIRDRGVGIGAEELPLLFQMFSRVGSRSRLGVRGSGLGLYICSRIVEAQGGRIWAESRRGVGTVFAYTLPVAEVAWP
jgi:PAS domain S-box-containing protein